MEKSERSGLMSDSIKAPQGWDPGLQKSSVRLTWLVLSSRAQLVSSP